MAETTKDGGPAFPRTLPDCPVPLDSVLDVIRDHQGMTLRAYFAAKALPYCLARKCPPAWLRGSVEHREQACAEAVLIAEDLIAALNTESPNG